MPIPTEPYAIRKRPPGECLLLDRNEGPEPPADLWRGVPRVGATMREYPDPSRLERHLGDRHAVPPEQVVVTAGADDAIDRCCRAFLSLGDTVLSTAPTFAMLERFAALAGGDRRTVTWASGPFPLAEMIDVLREPVALVAVVSPNNPTGLAIARSDLRDVATAAKTVPVLLDHAYVEYADDDLTDEVARLPNLIVVRTLSKAWGLAGSRVGYAIAAPEVASRLRSAGAPYPVAGLSLALAERWLTAGAALVAGHVERVRTHRTVLGAHLDALGVRAQTSQGNFVLAECGRRGRFLCDALRARGILVRDFTACAELDGAVRVTVPGGEQAFASLTSALETALAPDAVLFDLDGVLADVSASYHACIAGVARSFGVELDAGEIARAQLLGDANDDWALTTRLLRGCGVSVSRDVVTGRFQDLYLGNGGREGLRAREGPLVSPEWLARIAARHRVGVVTGRPRAEAEWFLARHGMRGAVAALVTREDGPAKPDPALVRRALGLLGARRAWMIGDTPDDVRAAARAGALPIGVVAPGHDRTAATAALRQAGAARVLAHLAELEELLP